MKMFKTSMRGFKKSDVNNYIIELNKDFSDLKTNYELEITELKLNLKASEEKLENFNEIENKLNEALNDNSALKELTENLESKVDKLSAENSALLKENEEVSENLKATTDENHAMNSELRDKNTIIEGLSEDLGSKDALILAQTERITNLEQTLSDIQNNYTDCERKFNILKSEFDENNVKLTQSEATEKELLARNKELEDILKQALAKISAYESERATNAEREIITRKARIADAALSSAASSVTTNVNDAIVESAESCLKEFQQFADKVQFTSKSAISELADEYTQLASRAAYYCDVLDSSTKKTISEFRGKANSICKDLKNEQ